MTSQYGFVWMDRCQNRYRPGTQTALVHLPPTIFSAVVNSTVRAMRFMLIVDMLVCKVQGTQAINSFNPLEPLSDTYMPR